MKSNLHIFRSAVKEHLLKGQISSLQQFKELAQYLCDLKLFSASQSKRLQHKIISSQSVKFPISIQQFQQTIMINFGDNQGIQILQGFKDLKSKLRQVKGVLNIWKDKGLSRKERLELQAIFERGNSQLKEIFEKLQEEKNILSTISQQEQQMIESLEEWISMQHIKKQYKDFKDYQTINGQLIDQTFNQIRVREVHFRNRPNSKASKIQRLVGMDSRNDQPVEVTLIPKKKLNMQELNLELLTFNARKQLLLAQHFPRFLGYNTHIDPNYFLYFSEHTTGICLKRIIQESQIQLEEQTPIFKSWAYQIYKCFFQLFYMSSFVARLPLTLEDFTAQDSGLRLVANNIRFCEDRIQSQQFCYEAQLLQNLGFLLLQLLKLDQCWEQRQKIKLIDNKNIINCLLHAKIGHQHYKEGRVKNYLNLHNIQTHPLFQSGSKIQGEIIIDNYLYITNKK